jgi:hypothetical protein
VNGYHFPEKGGMNKMFKSIRTFLIISVLFLFPAFGHAYFNPPSKSKTLVDEMTELSRLDFEDLMNLEITSVSKKTQKVSEAVARIDANKWAIYFP